MIIAALFQITMNYVLFAYLDGSQQNSNTNVIHTNTVVNCNTPLKHFYSTIHYACLCPQLYFFCYGIFQYHKCVLRIANTNIKENAKYLWDGKMPILVAKMEYRECLR